MPTIHVSIYKLILPIIAETCFESTFSWKILNEMLQKNRQLLFYPDRVIKDKTFNIITKMQTINIF